MMKINNYLLAIVILTTVIGCMNEGPDQVADTQEVQITIGSIDTFYSSILGESRDLWIHVPKSVDGQSGGQTKLPVLYLLDGSSHFHSVTGMIRQLSTINGNTVSPEMIVVGITNTDRVRDLTPTRVDGTSGGGMKFFDFIEQELIPYIETNYPANNYRTFVGHSLGGLMVIDALISRPHLFENYVAIDPSLWWDEQVMLKKAETALIEVDLSGKSLYLAIANTMTEGMDIDNVVNDRDDSTMHIRSILQFAEVAEANTESGLNFDWKYYQNNSHGSVPIIAEYDAIRFLFPWYELRGLIRFVTPNTTATPEELVNHLVSHYENLSDRFGHVVLLPEQFANQQGYAFLANGQPEMAHALFALNIQNYPNSANVFDSMGDYYAAQSDTNRAIEHYTKAVAMGGNIESKDKLDRLKAENQSDICQYINRRY